MKKVSLGLLCLVWAISSCEIPQSLTIKGNPGLAISIGSPFSDGNRLEDYLDLDEIRRMMGGDGDSRINVYDYIEDPTSDVQVFLIHYPITRMELDLSDYVSGAMLNTSSSVSVEIPEVINSISPGLFPAGGYYLTENGYQESEGDPLFVISFADMAKLVISVEGNVFAIDVEGYDADFKEYVYVKIPAFGFDDYKKGIEIGGKLRFVEDTKKTFCPQDDLLDGNLEIYVRVMGPCSGTIAPELVFDWTEAIIDTSDNENLKDEYNITNSLGEFLGESIVFNEVLGYVYVGGIDNNFQGATMSIWIDDGISTNNISEDTPLISRPVPVFTGTTVTEKLPEHSFTNMPSISLTTLLNSSSRSSLEYEVKIPKTRIENNGNTGEIISVDMVVVLPLALTVSTPLDIDTGVFADSDTYVKLDMGAIFDLGLGDDGSDLFGRESDDDLLSNLSLVKITLKDFKNDLIKADMGILLTAPYPDGISYYSDLMLFDDNQSLEISDIKGLNPFIPSFEIVIKKDENKKYATFGIKRPSKPNPTFDFSLTVEVQAEISHTIPLD